MFTFNILWAYEIHCLMGWIFHSGSCNAQLFHHTMQKSLDVSFRNSVWAPSTVAESQSQPADQQKGQAAEQG